MKNNKGLSLIELVIVVTIIAALAVIALTFYRNQSAKALDAKRKADLQRIKIAVEEYEKDHNCYPPPQLLNCNPGTGLQPYIDKIPCDPTTGFSYLYEYSDSICPNWYKLFTNLEHAGDISITPGIGPNNAYNFFQGSANAPSEVSGTTTPGGGTPVPSGGGVQAGYYGCRGGVCVEVLWNPQRSGPECDPSFQNQNCYGQCGPPANECVTWVQ